MMPWAITNIQSHKQKRDKMAFFFFVGLTVYKAMYESMHIDLIAKLVFKLFHDL